MYICDWSSDVCSSDLKLFCEVCSAFNYSFDDSVGEKVVSPSYSSAILAPLSQVSIFKWSYFLMSSLHSKRDATHLIAFSVLFWNEKNIILDLILSISSRKAPPHLNLKRIKASRPIH